MLPLIVAVAYLTIWPKINVSILDGLYTAMTALYRGSWFDAQMLNLYCYPLNFELFLYFDS